MGYEAPAVRDNLKELSGYHSPQLDVDVRLNTNESPQPPPAAFTNSFTQSLQDLDWNRYPDRKAVGLRKKIADMHSRQGYEVNTDHVFVANGSNEILQTLLVAWAGPGRKVATFAPTYAMHSQIARVLGSELIEIERDKNFEIDLQKGLAQLKEHRPIITFLCSPNNPTGLIESREVIEKVADTVSEFGLLVVDEAYAEFSNFSALELIRDDSPIIVTRTFSKTWAMAAARLGYLIAPEWVVEKCYIAALPYHVNALSQMAGELALDYQKEMQDRIALITSERSKVIDELESFGLDVWASQSNFVLFRPNSDEGHPSGEDIWRGLVDRSVLIRNCASWPGLEGCLRVTIGTAEENWRFLQALSTLL